jgi:hypothetical protein
MPVDERLWRIAFSNIGDFAPELLAEMHKAKAIIESNWEDRTEEISRLREISRGLVPALQDRIRAQRRELKRLNRAQRHFSLGAKQFMARLLADVVAKMSVPELQETLNGKSVPTMQDGDGL